mgnify:CR=1 FL=1
MSNNRKQLLSYQALIDKMIANGILFNTFDQDTAKDMCSSMFSSTFSNKCFVFMSFNYN